MTQLLNSGSMVGLRQWQRVARERYETAGRPNDFLVTATPGAGKTAYALSLARDLLDSKYIRRIIVVCPTDHLRSQWAEAANRFGIALDPSLPNQVGPISPDFHGAVVTYAQVAARPALHERRATSMATLVILDEIHHAGDGLSWGEAVLEAFSSAKRRLALTGTPFRTSATEKIPFVRYGEESDGSLRSAADYTYGYKEALADGVVRPVIFAAYSGVARWRTSAGEVVAASLSEPLTKDAEMAAWRTVLNPAGDWIRHVIASADDRLTEVREGMPDAGGMLLASDQDQARAYADVLQDVTGHQPTLVLSDDNKASSRIEEFSANKDRWLIAVRMVSEGVDIPRLAVGVWATSYRTPLFFAQAIGRFVRARRKGETATVFLPAVRPLLTMAADLEAERDHILAAPKQQDDGLDEVPTALETERGENTEWEAVEAQAQFAHVLYGGRAMLGDEVVAAGPEDEEFLGIPGLLTPEQTAAVLKQREEEVKKRAARKPVSDSDEPPPHLVHQQSAALRREINRLVGRIARKTGQPHASLHARVRRHVPGPPSASAPIEILQQRRDKLREDLGT
ncbi:MAG TPA: DEAD/DEAH box helicase family protein [Mycobacteriales bacterium]|nr:DEAD/DEAH box helicase family protein [Mycobacteriales bacterium]